ncbi:MAG: glycosyltransferase family 4 protein [Candidatus Paceibacterota bacterium]
MDKKIKILVAGDNGECLPPPYGGIMKKCLMHARVWIENGAEVFMHIHHRHDKEDKLGAEAVYFYDFKKKPNNFEKILFVLKNFFYNPAFFTKLFFTQKKLFPNFDLTLFLYCSAKGVEDLKAIKKYKPDIVLFETGCLESLVALLAAKKYNLPAVLENYAEIQYKSKDDTINIASKYEKLWKYIVNNSDLIISSSVHCSKGPAAYAENQSKIKIAYSGINFNAFDGRQFVGEKAEFREKFGLPKDKKIIISVGAITHARKGHDHIFDAISLMGERAKDVFLVLCGSGDPSGLISYAASLNFNEDSFKIFQRLDEADLAKLYASADCFCFPSTTPRECMGLALKEAMSSGLPAVAYDSGGIPEAVENGVNGFISPIGDRKALGENLLKALYLTEEERNKIFKANISKAEELFSIKKTASKILDLCSNLVQNWQNENTFS